MPQNVTHSTKMLPHKQQSRQRPTLSGFAFVPLRAVFSDSIRRAVETGGNATRQSDDITCLVFRSK